MDLVVHSTTSIF